MSTLINAFQCDLEARGYLGRSILHSACASGYGKVVETIGKYVSPLVVDDNGDTPLHIACSGDHDGMLAMLKFNPPILLRNTVITEKLQEI